MSPSGAGDEEHDNQGASHDTPSSLSNGVYAEEYQQEEVLDKQAAFSLFQRLQTHVKKDTTVKKKRRKWKSRALKNQRQQEVIEALAGFASSSSGNSLLSSKATSNASGNSIPNYIDVAKAAMGSDLSLRVAASAAAGENRNEGSSSSSDEQRQAAQAMMARFQLYEEHDGLVRERQKVKKQSAKRAEEIEQAVFNLQVEQLNAGLIAPSFDGSSLNSIKELADEEEDPALDEAVKKVEIGIRRGRRRTMPAKQARTASIEWTKQDTTVIGTGEEAVEAALKVSLFTGQNAWIPLVLPRAFVLLSFILDTHD